MVRVPPLQTQYADRLQDAQQRLDEAQKLAEERLKVATGRSEEALEGVKRDCEEQVKQKEELLKEAHAKLVAESNEIARLKAELRLAKSSPYSSDSEWRKLNAHTSIFEIALSSHVCNIYILLLWIL